MSNQEATDGPQGDQAAQADHSSLHEPHQPHLIYQPRLTHLTNPQLQQNVSACHSSQTYQGPLVRQSPQTSQASQSYQAPRPGQLLHTYQSDQASQNPQDQQALIVRLRRPDSAANTVEGSELEYEQRSRAPNATQKEREILSSVLDNERSGAESWSGIAETYNVQAVSQRFQEKKGIQLEKLARHKEIKPSKDAWRERVRNGPGLSDQVPSGSSVTGDAGPRQIGHIEHHQNRDTDDRRIRDAGDSDW